MNDEQRDPHHNDVAEAYRRNAEAVIIPLEIEIATISAERDEARAVIALVVAALEKVRVWEASLAPEDGIRYGAYYPAFAVNAALTDPRVVAARADTKGSIDV